VSSGLIDCDKKEYSPEERFKQMCFSLKDLFMQVSPEFLVLEQVAYQRNAAALIELARLQGVLISRCFDIDIPFYIYPPSSWRKDIGFKQGAGIKRKELKLQAIEYVRKNYGINANEDTAESIAIGSAFTITYLKENA
jgi:crossover junction endodeoxyribonuclease RuvC